MVRYWLLLLIVFSVFGACLVVDELARMPALGAWAVVLTTGLSLVVARQGQRRTRADMAADRIAMFAARTRTSLGSLHSLLVGAMICVAVCMPIASKAKVVKSVLNVNLVNPVTAAMAPNGVSQITFTLMSPGIGAQKNLGTSPANIIVSSPGANKFGGIGGTQAGVNVSFVGMNVVNVTLTPLKVYTGGTNVQFTLTVLNTNNVRIVSGFGGAPPAWVDNSTPPKKLKAPAIPGFMVVAKDAEYTAFDDTPNGFDVENLQYMPNITEAAFDSIDLNSELGLSPSPPGDALSPGGDFDQPGLPDPSPGDFFAAEGQIYDTDGTTLLGDFSEGVQVAAVPEPAVLTFALASLGALALFKRRRPV